MQLLSLQIIANPLFSQPSLFSASDSSNTACPAHQPSNCSTSSCYFYAAGFALGAAALGYFIGLKLGGGKSRVNTKVQVAKDLVVDMVDMEDIGEKKGFCRCWKSEKWPFCDGAHVKHNQATGDNIGPLVVKGRR